MKVNERGCSAAVSSLVNVSGVEQGPIHYVPSLGTH